MSRTINDTRAGFTVIELVVSIGITTLLLGLLFPAIQAARTAAVRAKCMNNLRQIGIGWHAYEAAERRGLPRQWAIELLPYLERSDVAHLPPAERAVQPLAVYRCPNGWPLFEDGQACGSYRVSAFVIDEIAFPAGRSNTISSDESQFAGLWVNSPTTFAVDLESTLHPSGVNVLWCDGHVTFESTQTPPQLLRLDPFDTTQVDPNQDDGNIEVP